MSSCRGGLITEPEPLRVYSSSTTGSTCLVEHLGTLLLGHTWPWLSRATTSESLLLALFKSETLFCYVEMSRCRGGLIIDHEPLGTRFKLYNRFDMPCRACNTLLLARPLISSRASRVFLSASTQGVPRRQHARDLSWTRHVG